MAQPEQLPLELGAPPAPTFDNFVAAGNEEALLRLRALVPQVVDGTATDRLVYLWGEEGSGRSHLLQAICAQAEAGGYEVRTLEPDAPAEAYDFDPDVTVWTIDDAEHLDEWAQIAVFNLVNEVRAHPHAAIAIAGAAAPMSMPLREDLRTRLGWGLVYWLRPLSDADKVEALRHAARERGMQLSADVPQWLVTHSYRDMPSLMALLDALDTYSLARKRAVTLPLVRDMLALMK
ncbi:MULTISPECIES: DnaA regulatory inactivator Hda [Ralstonia]|jgi:DnaA family protein|uniref:DnaA regulatory inactivator Hda n=1 Tax=Ralstonia flaminis TaxID=3058597 RepID=A0ABM9K2A3_9RALS|nr:MULTISPECIES: DnaA regulatory inactivator Hda [unclassified Ralstonia]CAJ0810890.1 DnaA regulatory inactivator Hda [Ralstonia sp. LMG 18101]